MKKRIRWMALGAAAVAFGACSDEVTSPDHIPDAVRRVPGAVSRSVTLNGNSFVIASDASGPNPTLFCPNATILGVFTTFPASQPPLAGCVTALDLQTPGGALDTYNPGWDNPAGLTVTGGHWVGFNTPSGGPSSDYRATPGKYFFQQTFTLPAGVTAPSLSLDALADNVVAVYLNGTLLGQQAMTDCNNRPNQPPVMICNWQVAGKLHVTAAAGLFNAPGVENTLTFIVNDSPIGFQDQTQFPVGFGGPQPDYGCPFRDFQATGSHGFSGDNAVQTSAGHAGPHPTGLVPADQMTPHPTQDQPNPGQDGCENPTGLAFAGTVSWTPAQTPCPAGSFSFFVDAAGMHIKYDQFPAPNDNSYGVNAVGWPNGHKFTDLVGSDHAGFQLRDQNGVVQLSFNADYISQVSTAPSGYASLGVTGGDGKMLVGTADGITTTSSLANNLNNINLPGLFNASHVQQYGSVNLLQDSPPTDAAHQTYNISDPTLANWDFHDTYFVTISPAKLAAIGFNQATWTVEPNLDQLHNSPAKPCPPGPGNVSATKYETKDKQVLITITNSGSADVFLEALTLNWPAANGKLMQIKLDGDVEYNVATASGPISLTTAQLPSDPNHRKINHNSSDVYTLIFEKNVDPNLANYSGTVTFSGTTLTILPH